MREERGERREERGERRKEKGGVVSSALSMPSRPKD